jgi:hypothetical protein
MKKYSVFLISVAILLGACRQQIAQPAESPRSEEGLPNGKGNQGLNISDFVPCTDCEFDGELVNPLPEVWSDTEKELYRVTIDFWEQTTSFLFSSEMVDLYKSSGSAACRDRFVKVIGGELKNSGNTVASEDPIRPFGWRNRFQESAILQMESSEPCSVEGPLPMSGTESYDKWEEEVCKCLDIVFHAGVPVCFYVERPILQDSQSAVVRLRLYDTVDSEGGLHMASGHFLHFENVDGVWLFSMRGEK